MRTCETDTIARSGCSCSGGCAACSCGLDDTGRCCPQHSPYQVAVCPDKFEPNKTKREADRGIRLFVKDIGPKNAPMIVFLHSWPLNSDQWAYQFIDLPARGFRCIAIDMRGFGRSDQPFDPYNTLDVWADDVRALLEELNVNNITLVGHSFGARVAIRYVARHKCCRVSRLLVSSTSADEAENIGPDLLAQILGGLRSDQPDTTAFVTSLFYNTPTGEAFADWNQNMANSAALWALIPAFQTIYDDMLTADLAKVCVPAVVIGGAFDAFDPPETVAAMAAAMPNARFVLFATSGHATFFDQKQEFNDEIAALAETANPRGHCGRPSDRACATKRRFVSLHSTGPVVEEL